MSESFLDGAFIHRRVQLFASPLPLLFIETSPGARIAELLEAWGSEAAATDARVILRADQIDGDAAAWFSLIEYGARTAGASEPAPLTVTGQVSAAAAGHGYDALVDDLAASLRYPLTVVVSRADFLPPEVFAELLEHLSRHDSIRLVVAGFDTSALQSEARGHRIPFSGLVDRDFVLTADEISILAGELGVTLSPAEQDILLQRTSGLADLVSAALRHYRDRLHCASGSTDRIGAAASASWLDAGDLGSAMLAEGMTAWPSPLIQFIRSMAHVPRFTVAQAATIVPGVSVRVLLARLVALDMGQLVFHPPVRQTVFRWYEGVRRTTLQYLQAHQLDSGALQARVIEAARQTTDFPLLVSALVEAGQLRDAETQLSDWLWDFLPNGRSPVWEPLTELTPDQLAEYPHLACVRNRILAECTPVGSAPGLVPTSAAGKPSYSPRNRAIKGAALAIEQARLAGRIDEIPPLVEQVRQWVDRYQAGEVRPALVSDVLLIADALCRLGNLTVAAEFAADALQFLSRGSRRCDPWGERAGFAHRLILASRRERGLPDDADAAAIVAGPQFRWRDADRVAQAHCEAWDALDQGEITAADRICREALDQVVQPRRWPALWYLRQWVSVLSGQEPFIELAHARYLDAREATGLTGPRTGAPAATGRGALSGAVLCPPAVSRLSELLSVDLTPPVFLHPRVSVDSDQRWTDAPRARLDELLLEALSELRAGRPQDAIRAMLAGIRVAGVRQLAPLSLVVAQPDEVRQLAMLISVHPDADRLHLDVALEVARHAGGAIELSEREGQVLDLLREGLTNKDMAAALYVTVNTVKFHRANVMRKLGAANRQQLLDAAAKAGL